MTSSADAAAELAQGLGEQMPDTLQLGEDPVEPRRQDRRREPVPLPARLINPFVVHPRGLHRHRAGGGRDLGLQGGGEHPAGVEGLATEALATRGPPRP